MESAPVGKKIDKKAHQRATDLHSKEIEENPECREALKNMLAAIENGLSEVGLGKLDKWS